MPLFTILAVLWFAKALNFIDILKLQFCTFEPFWPLDSAYLEPSIIILKKTTTTTTTKKRYIIQLYRLKLYVPFPQRIYKVLEITLQPFLKVISEVWA